MLVGKTHIENFLPQRAPIVMVDELLEASTERAITRFEIQSNTLFVENNFLTEAGLIENIAQTAAAQAGYLAQQQGVATPVGFIASINDLRINQFPNVGAVLTTSIAVINRVFEVIIIQAQTKQDMREICSCQMKIFIKPQDRA